MTAALALRLERVSPWQAHLAALAAAWAAIFVLFYRDAADIAAIWWSSSTFNHCLLIPPLIAWLVWQRLPELQLRAPAAWLPGLALVGAGGVSWLLGEAGGIAFARHLGLAVMLQGAVIACLGKSVARGLIFPLFYALFMVPAGEEIVPVMQTVTAEIASALLALTGVPAHLEGIFITTPTGYFEVAEACAGVKFLIAMAAFGALVANVCFRSWPRRIAFLAAALIVPILANGVRAWGTIYIAHRSGSTEFAASFDHVVYGGVFFAVVIALVIGAGWRFFDRGIDDPWLGPDGSARRSAPLALTAAAVVALAALPPLWSGAGAADPIASEIVLPDASGWQRGPAGREWRPRFAGADRVATARYRDRQGRTVDLAVAVFASQSEGRELASFGQGEAPGWAWTASAPPPPGGRAERIASHGLERQVLRFYRVGNVVTGSGVGVKFETLKVRLLGGPQRAVAVLVSGESRPAIDAFLAAAGPVDRLADRAAGQR